MILKDILKDKGDLNIIYRTAPDDKSFGRCKYKNDELISCDGNEYYLEETIESFDFVNESNLIVWIFSKNSEMKI